MSGRLQLGTDVQAGLFFIAIGGGTIYLSTSYRFGSAQMMGPGFFPIVLGGVLVLLGIAIAAAGYRQVSEPAGKLRLRQLFFLIASLLAFAILLPVAGLVPAIVAAVVLASFCDPRMSWTFTALLAAGLVAFSYLVFVRGLGLLFPAVWGPGL